MAVIEVPLEGLGAYLDSRMKRFQANMQPGVHRFLEQNRTMADMEMKRGYYRVGLKRRTGKLMAGTHTEVTSRPNEWTMIISNQEKHAVWMEKGTSPHVIEGRPLLRWEDESGVHFARRVHHPGTRPYRFISEPAKWVAKQLTSRIVGAIQRIWEASA